MGEILVKTENITKEFPGVVALENVSFDVMRGETLAIVGENGAGKSTLMNILCGVYQASSGNIIFDGKNVRFKDPLDAQNHGIAMIHQELSVAPKLSVMENIFIGRLYKNKFGLVDYKNMRLHCKEKLRELGNDSINPDQMVAELSMSQRQIVEIAKALCLNAKLLIMDEPTSSLTKSETEGLLETIEGLSKKGVSVLFISHKMDEVFKIADRIAVFRDGNYIDTLKNENVTHDQIISLMVGRTFIHSFKRNYKMANPSDQPVLQVEGLTNAKLHDISFSLYPGEVLAITGLVGAGRTELLQALFGIDRHDSGKVVFEGKAVRIKDAKQARDLGIGLVPEGRKLCGLFMNMTVMENETICILDSISNAKVINQRQEEQKSEEVSAKLSVKTPSLKQKVKFLSGGNQQKCIIGRWLLTKPKVLFMDEPTHGIDVGAKAEIYKIIDDLASSGVSVLMVSSELPEVLALADRVLVMRQGSLVAEIGREDATQEEIMRYAVN